MDSRGLKAARQNWESQDPAARASAREKFSNDRPARVSLPFHFHATADRSQPAAGELRLLFAAGKGLIPDLPDAIEFS